MRGAKAAVVGISALALLPAGATATPGDLIVGDSDTPSLVRVKPSGNVRTISTETDFDGPAGSTFTANGSLFLADYSAFSNNGAIFDVELPSGEVAPLVQADADMPQPVFVDWHPNGFLYVADFQSNHLLRIDPQGNDAEPIADDADIFGITSLPNGNLLTSTLDGEFLLFGPEGVDAQGIMVSGDPLTDAYGLSVDARGRVLIAEQGGDIARLTVGTGRIKRVADGGAGLLESSAQAVEMPSGKIAVAAGDNGVVIVNPRTGGKRRLTEAGEIAYAEGITIEPPKCKGRLANIVGTNGRDRLKGSRFPDVIAGLGGRDTIKGLGGNDRLCGNGGGDALFGGPGTDRLSGGPGHDELHQ
jgi:Ca2+-binding RTX toxin-like protein